MTAPGRKGFGKQLGIVAAVFACSPGPSCADQDTFFPVGERTFLLPCRNASGGSASRRPPKARLRIRRCACICHRQRLAPDSRKATRGSVLWTPRKGGESKGVTRVAARAVRRGLEPRIPLTLNRTSDRDFAPPQPAARENRKRQKALSLRASAHTGVVYALRVQSVASRAAEVYALRVRPPLQVQSGIFISDSTADGVAARHGSCTRCAQCSVSAQTISRSAKCCPRLASFSLWSPRTVSLFAQDRKEKWVLLYAGQALRTAKRQ